MIVNFPSACLLLLLAIQNSCSGRRSVNMFGRSIPAYRRNPYHPIRGTCVFNLTRRVCFPPPSNRTRRQITTDSSKDEQNASSAETENEQPAAFNLGTFIYGRKIHEGQFLEEAKRRNRREADDRDDQTIPTLSHKLSSDSRPNFSPVDAIIDEEKSNRLLNWKIEQKIDGEGDTVSSNGTNTADVKVFQFNVAQNGTLEQLQHFGPYASFSVNTEEIEAETESPPLPSPLHILRPNQKKLGVLMDILEKQHPQLIAQNSHERTAAQRDSTRNDRSFVQSSRSLEKILSNFEMSSGSNVYQIIMEQPTFYVNERPKAAARR